MKNQGDQERALARWHRNVARSSQVQKQRNIPTQSSSQSKRSRSSELRSQESCSIQKPKPQSKLDHNAFIPTVPRSALQAGLPFEPSELASVSSSCVGQMLVPKLWRLEFCMSWHEFSARRSLCVSPGCAHPTEAKRENTRNPKMVRGQHPQT